MTTRAPRQSAAEWSHIIAEFNRSNSTVEDFCSQRGYALSTFNRWKLRYSKQSSRHPLVMPAQRPGFVEALPAESGSVTIRLGDYVRMECPLSLGVDHIAHLAKAVANDERA